MARDNVDRTPWQPGMYFSPGEGMQACYWPPQTHFARSIAAATDAASRKAAQSSALAIYEARKLRILQNGMTIRKRK